MMELRLAKITYKLFLFGFFVMTAGVAQSADWSPLVDTSTLAVLLRSDTTIRVVHVTGNASAGLIPGAIFVPYAEFRGPADNAGQLPPLEKLQALVQRLGIEADTPVVIVHQGSTASDFGAATRVYWTLKSLGVQQLAVLNGGFHQWLAAGLPVSEQPATVRGSNFSPVWHDTWRISTQQVEQSLGDKNVILVDSRPVNFYLGQQAVAARPGTISGAANLSFETWFDGAVLKPVDQLQPLLLRSGVVAANPATTVAFCNTGHWASINWFVLSELLSVPDTRLYAESVVQWAQQPRPMDNQPGRLSWYWQMTRQWLSQITGL